MKSTLVILAALACLTFGFVLGCASLGEPGKTGYRGPVPSPAAQQLLRELRGETWTDAISAFGGGVWEIGPFSVKANDASPGGKGPVLRLDQGDDSVYVPLETDGDVADLFYKVMRKVAPNLEGDMSETYRALWKK